MILAGDIGGTKVDLGLFEVEGDRPELLTARRYVAEDFPGPEPVLETFLQETGARPESLCLGVAGPVIQGRCRLTHRDWILDADQLKSRFGMPSVRLVNDLAAIAASVPYLEENDTELLYPGEERPEGRRAVLAPGTGLGQAFLVPLGGGRWQVLDTEGGQVDFAPRNEEEIDLFHYWQSRRGRLSVEDFLSGPGLVRLYHFFRDRSGSEEPEDPARAFPGESPAGVISRRGLKETEGPCRAALDRFVQIWGAVAGNLALQILPRGGLYFGGGIAPQLAGRLRGSDVREAFLDKGNFRTLLECFPVRVIMNSQAGLWGAAVLCRDDQVVLG